MTETVRGGRYLDGSGHLVNAAGEPIRAKSKAAEQSVSDASDLPHDFPGRSLLIEAGHTTAAAVAELDKAALTAINGIGPATADQIIAARG